METKTKQEYDEAFDNLFKSNFKGSFYDMLEILIVLLSVIIGLSYLGGKLSLSSGWILAIALFIIISYMEGFSFIKKISPMHKRHNQKWDDFKKKQIAWIVEDMPLSRKKEVENLLKR